MHLNRDTIQELHEAFVSAKEDHEIKVVILTGTGEKAFVAGADISEFADFSAEEGRKLAAEGQEKLFDLVANFPNLLLQQLMDLLLVADWNWLWRHISGSPVTMPKWDCLKFLWELFRVMEEHNACHS